MRQGLGKIWYLKNQSDALLGLCYSRGSPCSTAGSSESSSTTNVLLTALLRPLSRFVLYPASSTGYLGLFLRLLTCLYIESRETHTLL